MGTRHHYTQAMPLNKVFTAEEVASNNLDWGQVPPGGVGESKENGLFSCFSDIGVCVKGWCCPCLVYGDVSERMGDNCLMSGLMFALCPGITACCYAPSRRIQIRGVIGLNHGGLDEGGCLPWICCGGCANCQEVRELDIRRISTASDANDLIKVSKKQDDKANNVPV